jgi:hypothetical protein
MLSHNIQPNNFQDRNNSNSLTQNIRRSNGINVNPNMQVQANNYQYRPQQFSQPNNAFGMVDQTRVNKNVFNPQFNPQTNPPTNPPANQINWPQPPLNPNIWNQPQTPPPHQYPNNFSLANPLRP